MSKEPKVWTVKISTELYIEVGTTEDPERAAEVALGKLENVIPSADFEVEDVYEGFASKPDYVVEI